MYQCCLRLDLLPGLALSGQLHHVVRYVPLPESTHVLVVLLLLDALFLLCCGGHLDVWIETIRETTSGTVHHQSIQLCLQLEWAQPTM